MTATCSWPLSSNTGPRTGREYLRIWFYICGNEYDGYIVSKDSQRSWKHDYLAKIVGRLPLRYQLMLQYIHEWNGAMSSQIVNRFILFLVLTGSVHLTIFSITSLLCISTNRPNQLMTCFRLQSLLSFLHG